MESWFHNPSELVRSDAVLSFWPTDSQTPAERINASSRFVIYLACLLYLIKRDARVLVLAAMVLGALFCLDRFGVVKDGMGDQACQLPTEDNAIGNVLLTDYVDNPDRPPACYYPTVRKQVAEMLDNTVKFTMGRSRGPLPSTQRKAFARQFMPTASSTIPNDQTGFAEALYGKKNRILCRDDSSACDPNYWGGQTAAFAGLDVGWNPRG